MRPFLSINRLSVPNLARKAAQRRFANVVKSPYPFDGSQIPNAPFGKFVLEKLERNPNLKDEICMIDGSTHEAVSFGQQYESSYRLAASLRKQGTSDGYGVAIISANHINFFNVMIGTSLTGGYSIPMNPLCSELELRYQLDLADAKLAFVHPSEVPRVYPIAKSMNIRVVSIDNVNNGGVEEVITFSDFIKDAKMGNIDINSFPGNKKFDKENIAIVPFSSGTTGKMKGVMLTNTNIMANLIQTYYFEGTHMEKSRRTGQRGVCLTPLPFYHIYAMTVQVFSGFYTGCKLVFLPAFDLVRYLELIAKYKATRLHLVPPVALALAKHPIVSQYDLSSVELVLSGAAPLGGEVQEACSKRLNCPVRQAWGMTELSPVGTAFADEAVAAVASIKGKSGWLVGGTEGKVVHPETGVDLPSTSEGEIMIRGPQVMKGYLKNEEATKSTIRPDGWMHTGDIGYFHEDGSLIITDRSKELIKYKGSQVPPAELEAVILTMPEVKDVIVIPVPDDEAGEIPRAYVVKQDNCPDSFTEADVVAYVEARVSPPKKLRGGARFTASVPKSASGKLLRRIQIQLDRESSK